MLGQALSFFSFTPDFDLALMQPNQSLFSLTSRLLMALEPVIEDTKPDWIFVQGDTSSVLAGALAAFYKQIKIAHIEVGLRSHNINTPFPEEMNRVLTTQITTAHFAPTPSAAQNLKEEGVKNHVYMVGNTVIDALRLGLLIVSQNSDRYSEPFSYIPLENRTILITCHRRESFGEPFVQICEAI
jgi:UDP-N-acetylglucosamine 2-epimerase (non-hydrolysing)